MTRLIIKIDIDQILEIEGHHSEVEVSTDRMIGEEHNMSILIEMTLGETILENCKIICQNFRGGYAKLYKSKF